MNPIPAFDSLQSGVLIVSRDRSVHRFWLIAGLFACALGLRASSQTYEVTVYSYVTTEGTKIKRPSAAQPVACALTAGRQQDFGDVGIEPNSASPGSVDRLMRHALTGQQFQCIGGDVPVGTLQIVYHWGCMGPIIINPGPQEEFLNRERMLALVGGRTLEQGRMVSSFERSDILAASREQRYFVILSAYFAGTRTLLWRTQMSVPTTHLDQASAVPLLLSVGAPLFGYDTPTPRRTFITLKGVLNPENQERQ